MRLLSTAWAGSTNHLLLGSDTPHIVQGDWLSSWYVQMTEEGDQVAMESYTKKLSLCP